MFECLVGYPPFCSESTHETYQKIIQWQHYLMFPDDVHLSREAEDLIRRFVCLDARAVDPMPRTVPALLPASCFSDTSPSLQTDHVAGPPSGRRSNQAPPVLLRRRLERHPEHRGALHPPPAVHHGHVVLPYRRARAGTRRTRRCRLNRSEQGFGIPWVRPLHRLTFC